MIKSYKILTRYRTLGILSSALNRKHETFMDTRGIINYMNYSKSKGNFIFDMDGKSYLDLFCQVASMPLGYNHPALTHWANNFVKEYLDHLINRPALGFFPSEKFVEMAHRTLLPIAPSGLSKVVLTTGGGSDAVEAAIKTVLYWEYKNNRNTNINPKILSFKNSYHGRYLSSLSVTGTNENQKKGIPLFPWPSTTFPIRLYPNVSINLSHNKHLEEFCLDKVECLCRKNSETLTPIRGIIVEPIQSEGGDMYASPEFFRELRTICTDWNALFLVDEVQTGMSTGKQWAHESWELDDPADIVIFAKKMQISGIYIKPELEPLYERSLGTTWQGDVIRLSMLETILKVIKDEKLFKNSIKTGNYLLQEAGKIKQIQNLRGEGSMIAFSIQNMENTKARELLSDRGIIVGICGQNTIRLRPSLVLKKKECDEFLKILKEISSLE